MHRKIWKTMANRYQATKIKSYRMANKKINQDKSQ